MMSTMSAVTLCECFARDGLQHEPVFVPTAAKRALVERFAAIGFPRVEATSYSNPRVVLQFADASDLLRSLSRSSGVFYKATCANQKSVQRAIADADAGYGVNEISLLVSATESHSQKNLKRSRAGQWANIGEMVRMAGGRFRIVGTVSVAFGCPFEGKVDPGLVCEDIFRFVELGVNHVAIGDTTGMANPIQAYTLVKLVLAKLKKASLAVHFHSFKGLEFANVMGALQAGVTTFDGAAGGLGGCPYAPEATGNMATEILFEMFERMGISTGIDIEKIKTCGEFANKLSSKCSRE